MANIIDRTTNPDSPTFRIKISLGKNEITGKYEYHSETFKGTKAAAKNYAKKLEIDLFEDTFVKNNDVTFNAFAETFLNNMKNQVRPSVYTGYLNDIKHLNKVLNGVKIQDVSVSQIESILHGMVDSGLSTTTANRTYSVGNRIMDLAIDRELLRKNPFKKVSKPRKAKPILNVPNKNTIDIILKNLENKKAYMTSNGETQEFLSWAYIGSMIAVHTGARRGEIMGLKWEDINFENLTLSILRNITDIGGFSINNTKTKSSSRTITITKKLANILQEYRYGIDKQLMKIENRTSNKSDWIFYNPFSEHKVLLPNALTKRWSTAVKECNLENIRFHDLRHFHAISLAQSGRVNIKDIQQRLGHEDSKITMDTYMRFMPQDEHRKVADVLEEIL